MGITEHTEVEIGDELPDPIIFFYCQEKGIACSDDERWL